jgi:hypothetical protein
VVRLQCCSSGPVGQSRSSLVLVGHPTGPEVSSIIAVFPSVLLRPTSTGPRELRSSPEFLFQCPGRWFPTLSLGIRPGFAHHCRHCCRSGTREPDLSAPPSTSSPASTPAPTLLPSLRLRGTNLTILFRPHRFSRSRRLSPPIGPITRAFAPLLTQDSRACCIPLPILGFAAFLIVVRVAPAPHTGQCWSVCSRSRERRVLAARFIPLKGFPSSAAVSCRHDRCLHGFRVLTASIDSSLPLPASTRVSRLRDASPSRRCSADESVPALAVSSVLPAYPFWALAPFEVLRPRDCSRGGCFAHAVRRHPSERNPCSFTAALVVPFWLEARSERASLRSAPTSSSRAVQPFSWGSLRRPWWRGVRREVFRPLDRDEAGSTSPLLAS